MTNIKKLLVAASITLLIGGTAHAETVVKSGNLVLNINKSNFNNFGGQVSAYFEHYFDQATANVTEGLDLITTDVDHIEIPSYSGLIFGINEFDQPGPVIGTQHQLQGTDFTFDDPMAPTGQIGFGGVLRISFYAKGTTTDSGFGEIGIGDFTLTKTDRSDKGADGASGWLFKTTSGIPAGKYRPAFDTTDVVVTEDSNSLTISGNLLWAPETLAFFGSEGLIEAGSFEITAVTEGVDTDGVDVTTEDAAPNSGDANNDGTSDSAQNLVSSLPGTSSNSYITVDVAGSSCSELADVSASSAAAADNYTYDAGLVEFTLNGCTSGGDVDVALYFHGLSKKPDSVRKYGKTSSSNGALVWQTIDGATITSETIDGNTVYKATYTITDGGFGDSDLTANGTIVDPVGPGFLPIASANGGASQQIPTLSEWAVILLMSLMGMMGIGYERKKKLL